MYSLLLVDDERTILNGLAYNIDWEETGFTGVYKAYSAKEALEILEKYRIDVVVSDISMPDMDGIELCRHVRVSWPMSKIIFLSGHRDFDYARQAVELNVYQYLVKPVAYEDLQSTVSGALDEVKMDLEQRDLLARAKEKMSAMEMLLRERLLSSWLLSGGVGLEAYANDLNGVGLRIDGRMAGFELLIEARDTPESIGNAVLQMGLHALAESLFAGHAHLLCLPVRRERMLIAFLCESQQAAEHLRAQYANRLDAFQLSAENSLGCHISLYMGRVFDAKALHGAYAELYNAAYRERAGETGRILLVEAPKEIDVFEIRRSLKEIVASQNGGAMDSWLTEVFASIRGAEKKNDYHRLLVSELRGVLTRDSIARGIRAEQFEPCCAPLFDQSALTGSAAELERVCRAAATGYAELVHSAQDMQRKNLVKTVRRIVETEMQEGLSVNAVAERLHYNPSYLSRLIKQETGQSLVDLIISIRVEEACRLLKAGNRVQDVALAVGYDNLAHFSRIFKKKMGVSPRQYN